MAIGAVVEQVPTSLKGFAGRAAAQAATEPTSSIWGGGVAADSRARWPRRGRRRYRRQRVGVGGGGCGRRPRSLVAEKTASKQAETAPTRTGQGGEPSTGNTRHSICRRSVVGGGEVGRWIWRRRGQERGRAVCEGEVGRIEPAQAALAVCTKNVIGWLVEKVPADSAVTVVIAQSRSKHQSTGKPWPT